MKLSAMAKNVKIQHCLSAIVCFIIMCHQMHAEFLNHESSSGYWQLQLEAEVRASVYTVGDNGNPGWFAARRGRGWEHSERLTLNGDFWLGNSVYAYAKIRYDDGLHPALNKVSPVGQNLRIDELFFAFTPLTTGPTIKVGRFAPAFGNYIGRNSWDNAFMSDPMIYDQVTSVSDQQIPVDAHNLAHYAQQRDNKGSWISVVWAPYYAEGAAIEYTHGNLFYSFAFMNRSVSSRPRVWNDHDWSNGSFISRIEYSENPEWKFGGSLSVGPYLQDSASLAPNQSVRDFHEITGSLDLTWSKHYWQVWAEAFWGRFEVPNAGNADSWSYYIEAKRKLGTKWFVAGRWNQQIFKKLPSPAENLKWDNNMWRFELAVGRKMSLNQLLKFQASYIRQSGLAPYPNTFTGLEYVIKF